MKIEVGKNYVTENGSIVKIKYNTNEMGFPVHLQPFGAFIKGRGAAFYTESGVYNLANPDSGFNIIKEI